MSNPQVELHTKTGCPFCDLAKTWFGSRSIQFTTIVHDDETERQAFYAQHGCSSVPQVFVIDGGLQYLVGGYAELVKSGIESLFRS